MAQKKFKDQPRIPYKQFADTRRSSITKAFADHFAAGQENVSAEQLQSVTQSLLRLQSDDDRNNWLELERWADRLRDYWETQGAVSGDGMTFPYHAAKFYSNSGWIEATDTVSTTLPTGTGVVYLVWGLQGGYSMGDWFFANLGDNSDNAFLGRNKNGYVAIDISIAVQPHSGGTIDSMYVEIPTAIATTAQTPQVNWQGWTVPAVTMGTTRYCVWSYHWTGPWPDWYFNANIRVQGTGNFMISGTPYGASSDLVLSSYKTDGQT